MTVAAMALATPHDARDTFAMMHLQRGSDRLTWVAMMLGHRHISTTLNRYTRWTKTVANAGFVRKRFSDRTRVHF